MIEALTFAVVVVFVVNLDAGLLVFNYYIFLSLLKIPLRVFALIPFARHSSVSTGAKGVKTMENKRKISID